MSSRFHPQGDVVEFKEHTADIWMTAKGGSPEEVLWKLVQGLYSLVSSTYVLSENGRPFKEDFVVDNLETAALKVLKEALFMLDAEKTVLVDPSFHVETRERALSIVVKGTAYEFDIPEGQGGFEVKAVTHHGVEFEGGEGDWRCKVLLDI